MTAAATRLVIADDHPLFRDALRQAVGSVVASARIDEAGSFDELTALLDQDSDVDLVLLDLTMPGISGFSGLIYLRAQFPAIPVVIVSASDDGGTIRQSLDFGASGFIPKRFGVDTLRDAIMKVLGGDVWVPADTDLSSATDPELARLRELMLARLPRLDPPLLVDDLPAIPARGLAALKAVEDRLDAVIAAYVAAHWWYWGAKRNRVVGGEAEGYIIVPARS